MTSSTTKLCFVLLVVALSGWSLYHFGPSATAADKYAAWHKGLPKQYNSEYLVHDRSRPQPKVVTPGVTAATPPADAEILFDGTSIDHWRKRRENRGPKMWDVKDGYMEVNNQGDLVSKATFGDCQLHIEWRTPTPPEREDQYRGNSGIFMMGRYEIQVLDSYQNPTYADGLAASLYGQHPPLVNACRPSGEWQTYDIIFRAPRFKDGKIAEPARVTVIHNGVLVQYNQEVYGSTTHRNLAKYSEHGPGPIRLQDHGDNQRMRFRNIWVRRLEL